MKKEIISIIILLIFVFTLLLGVAYLPFQNESGIDGKKYDSIITVWHIDSFEGGNVSCGNILKNLVSKYEHIYLGSYVHIDILTYNQALDKLSKGERFDILSFSAGSGAKFLPYLQAYEGAVFAKDCFQSVGEVSGKMFAVPYLIGCYSLIATKSFCDQTSNFTTLKDRIFTLSSDRKVGKNVLAVNAFCSGYSEFSSPLTALYLATSSRPDKSMPNTFCPKESQYKAFSGFINGECNVLLATQRDISRIEGRIRSNRIGEILVEPLGEFTDLIMCFAISSFTTKVRQCTNLIELVTCQETQKRLANYGVLSPLDITIYQEGHLSACERALVCPYVINAFCDIAIIDKLRQESLLGLYDDSVDIKKYLLKCF
ncbi:MAG: hypothetical protein RR248_00425 [Clostridia bacterium]